jgi:hypothetical protein
MNIYGSLLRLRISVIFIEQDILRTHIYELLPIRQFHSPLRQEAI